MTDSHPRDVAELMQKFGPGHDVVVHDPHVPTAEVHAPQTGFRFLVRRFLLLRSLST